MTTRQKRILLILTVVIGLSRVVAAAHSMFDWDEALFAAGVRDYDVHRHAPHPPGYPLFIAAAKAVHASGVDEFRSLQTVVIAGAVFLFPALALLGLELGLTFPVAVAGAAIFAFLPNVWVYGGTGFSDIPGSTLTLAGCALLLRGRRHSGAYLAGAVLLSAAAGMRVASLVIGVAPVILATWARLRQKAYFTVVAAALSGIVIVGGSYFGAALASESVTAYRSALDVQSQWVHDVDSFHNPRRPALLDVAWTFLIRPYDQRQQLTAMLCLAAVSLAAAWLQRRAGPLLTVCTFTPIAVFSCLYLDVNTPSRYAIAYLPMYSLLAADGLAVLVRPPRVFAGLAAAVVVALAVWTAPAIWTQVREDSPPIAALRWVRKHVPPSSTVYVHDAFRPQAHFYLPDYDLRLFQEVEEIPLLVREPWIVEGQPSAEGQNFRWPHERLWRVIRQRNFEASVGHLADVIRYGPGWYGQENSGTESFRWMGKEAVIELPAIPSTGKLTMKFFVPVDSLPTPPTIEIFFNDELVERIVATSDDLERTWILTSRPQRSNQLRIVTSATAVPSRTGTGSADIRELGLQLRGFRWRQEP